MSNAKFKEKERVELAKKGINTLEVFAQENSDTFDQNGIKIEIKKATQGSFLSQL